MKTRATILVLMALLLGAMCSGCSPLRDDVERIVEGSVGDGS